MSAGNWKRKLRLLLPAAVALVGVAAWLCWPRPSDQQLIQALLRRGEHGLETKNVSEVMGCVAPDYHDPEQTSRAELHRMVLEWSHVSEQGQLTIERYSLDIGRNRATGTVAMVFDILGQGQRTSFPMTLNMTFVKRRQGWRRVWLVQSVEGYREGTMIEGIGDDE